MAAKLLLRLALLCGLLSYLPLRHQDLRSPEEEKAYLVPVIHDVLLQADLARIQNAFRLRTYQMPEAAPGYISLPFIGTYTGFVSLSAFGDAFIATHTPPSDQLAGINMTISLRTRATAFDNSGRRVEPPAFSGRVRIEPSFACAANSFLR